MVAVLSGHVHRKLIHEHEGIQLVSAQATSRTHGGKPGFRLWHIEGKPPFRHESIDLEEETKGGDMP